MQGLTEHLEQAPQHTVSITLQFLLLVGPVVLVLAADAVSPLTICQNIHKKNLHSHQEVQSSICSRSTLRTRDARRQTRGGFRVWKLIQDAPTSPQ